MKKILLPILGLVLAIGVSALKAAHPDKFNNSIFFYTFSGLQVPADWGISSNYRLSNNPTTDPECAGNDECTVAIQFPVGIEPSDLSGLTLTVDANGFPNGLSSPPTGVAFEKNEKVPE
jgi:hypothetical protein